MVDDRRSPRHCLRGGHASGLRATAPINPGYAFGRTMVRPAEATGIPHQRQCLRLLGASRTPHSGA